MANGQTIDIDGKSYDVDSLSDEAKSQLGNIRAVDAELKRLEQKKGIARTARNAYARALQEELAKVGPQ
ncbi:hypothetical protein HKX15_17775 [Sulfitobacter sp. KE37]|uniref:DUF6447 family protein n=1 Tax=unclassified Sulfitobacter TaxID=196795 RepID=UPI0023E2BE3F|nr:MULTISPECIES: DUF6447 family protein [unclassified Sulfitobacter]MDF3351995.1 hypothetical protein [Sulfitobacter sp. KE12]MDF3355666.1 hypothetical protein [Sulfitobacter sp. KE27]MDF3370347.1 hypothetical protein [Sulfitobacter sp. Ks43]MDF3373998.1 hypothetical protein [Sulfitobacter sp. KS8]MDF3377632.1 hypothetical protein [Sulfitobacter sp. KE37]